MTEVAMKLMKKLLIFLCCICIHVFQIDAVSRYVKVGETFTVNASSKSYTQSVLWDWDHSILEIQGSLSGTSSSASFKALKKTPLMGSVIQATTYYYKNGTTSSGINKIVETWTVHVSDSSGGGDNGGCNVSMHMSSLNLAIGQTTNIMAYASENSYTGNYKWTSSDQSVLSIISQLGPKVTVKGISDGTSYLRVTLDNGNYDEIPIYVKSNAGGTTLDKFKFTLNDDGSGYIISARDNKKISGYIEIPAYYNNLPVTEIGEEGFKDSGITHLVLPKTITIIGAYAFQFNNQLTDVNLGSNLSEIQDCAFYGCDKLISIEFPPTLHKISNYAFSKCRALRSIYLPKSVTGIWGNPFSYCTNLTEINYEDADITESEYISLDGVLYMTDFKRKPIYLTIYPAGKSGNFEIPEDVEIISSDAFAGADKIQSVRFNEKVSSLNASAFEECIALEEIYLSKSLKFIGVQPFSGCRNIKRIFYPTEQLVSSDENMFPSDIYDKATLYVKKTVIDQVHSVLPWSLFKSVSILEENPSNVEDLIIDEKPMVVEVYNLTGQMIYRGTRELINSKLQGVYILKSGKTVEKIIF